MSRREILSALALSALLSFFPVLCLFIFPGIFILFFGEERPPWEGDTVSFFTHILFFSLAFWAILYWLTMFVPIPLTRLFYLCNVLFVALFLYLCRRRGLPRPPLADLKEPALILGWVLTAALRFVPFFSRITGSVGDMALHNAMTRIILVHNGYSPTYEPVFPFGHFGEYPPAFHTLAALLSLLGGSPLWRATNFLACFSFLLVHLALYVHVAASFSRRTALAVSSLLLFLSHYPQFLNQWGSATTALSTAFLFFAFHLLTRGGGNDGRPPLEAVLAAGLVLAAGALSHLVVPLGFLLYMTAWLITERIRGRTLLSWFKCCWPALLVCALCLIPFLLNFNFAVFGESRSTLQRDHEMSLARIYDQIVPARGSAAKKISEPFLTFAFLFGPITAALIVVVALHSFLRRRGEGEETDNTLCFFSASILLFVAAFAAFRYKIGPFSHLLQAERIHYFLLLPSSLLLAGSLKRWSGAGISKLLLAAPLAICLAAFNFATLKRVDFRSHYTLYKEGESIPLFLARDAGFGSYFAYALDNINSGVTEADISAFGWIREHLPEDAVFLTNYGDGGGLIPSLAERRAYSLHGMDLWHAAELAAWQTGHPPTHIFVGKRENPKYPTLFRAADLDREPVKYQKIYGQEGVSIYKIAGG